MVWPVGQPDGELRERALLSRSIWKQTREEAGIWYEKTGSLHLAFRKEEWQVLEELADLYRHRGYQLLDSAKTLSRLRPLYRLADCGISGAPKKLSWIRDKSWNGCPLADGEIRRSLYLGRAATDICYPAVYMGSDVTEADEIYVCSGADFETLYPEIYSEIPITRCKLQMMRPRHRRRTPDRPGALRRTIPASLFKFSCGAFAGSAPTGLAGGDEGILWLGNPCYGFAEPGR